MGYYINPTDGRTKEDWLLAHGRKIEEITAKAHTATSGDMLVVCLVDNGWMTAAAIAYNDRERDAFVRPDSRPKQWFLVSRWKLKEFLPE